MRRAIRRSTQAFAAAFSPAGPVLEVGSFFPPGHERLGNVRDMFPDAYFAGMDIRAGDGVDLVGDAHEQPFPDATFGCALAFEVFEHLPDPHRAVAEVLRVLRPDGVLAMSVPFNYRLHGMPSDYWRFTPSGVNVLLSSFNERIVFALGPRLKPAFVFAVAGKESLPPQRVEAFRELVRSEFDSSRTRGRISVFKERARDLFGFLLGRAELQVSFFDDAAPEKYRHGAVRDRAPANGRKVGL